MIRVFYWNINNNTMPNKNTFVDFKTTSVDKAYQMFHKKFSNNTYEITGHTVI